MPLVSRQQHARSPSLRPSAEPARGRADPQAPARPKVAVDIVLFAAVGGALRTYLVQAKGGPAARRWAFPGGLVRVGEVLEQAARRELAAATGLRRVYLEQLFTFGDPSRDPESHVVSVAYMALIAEAGRVTAPSYKYLCGEWFEVSRLPPLAYDHSLMADYALRRLRAKLEYSNIARNLLPERFTFTQLEEIYSMTLERVLDRRNFHRRIVATGLLRKLPAKRRGPHRPAALYSFARRGTQVLEIL